MDYKLYYYYTCSFEKNNNKLPAVFATFLRYHFEMKPFFPKKNVWMYEYICIYDNNNNNNGIFSLLLTSQLVPLLSNTRNWILPKDPGSPNVRG